MNGTSGNIGRKAISALFLAVITSLQATADVTNEIEVVALSAFGAAGYGETNGWFASHADSYSDGNNVRLSGKGNGGYLLSPDFGSAVRCFVLKAKSSSQTNRRLAFIPWDGMLYNVTNAIYCPYSTSDEKYEDQEIAVPEGITFSKFKIALIGSGSTGWGIQKLAVVTAATARPSPALPHLATNKCGNILLSSCVQGQKIVFQPNFAILAETANNTELADGWFPPLCARALSANSIVTNLSVNAGTTQYQGHYIWTLGTEGIGTYTAASIDRSWCWTFYNDTTSALTLETISAALGQWGARNTLPDHLFCEWSISSPSRSQVPVQAHPIPTTDTYVSTYTNDAPNAQFPVFERKEISHPHLLKRGEVLSLTFRDTCPDKGYNAMLGIAGLRIVAKPSSGALIYVR